MGGQTVITSHFTATHLLEVTQIQVSTYQNILLFVFFNSEMNVSNPEFVTLVCHSAMYYNLYLADVGPTFHICRGGR